MKDLPEFYFRFERGKDLENRGYYLSFYSLPVLLQNFYFVLCPVVKYKAEQCQSCVVQSHPDIYVIPELCALISLVLL